MRKLLILIVLTAFTFAGSISSRAEEVRDVIDSINSQKQFDGQDASQVVKVLLDAEGEDLPMRGLLNKVREGLAKRVDYWKIYEALVRKKEFLQQAKGIIVEAEECGVIAVTPKESIEELAKLLEGGEIDETLLRDICSLEETVGIEFQRILDVSTVLGNQIVLDGLVKREALALIFENQLDEVIASEIADELEEANIEGEDLRETMVKIRRRYK